MFASVHAASNGGSPNDAACLVRRVSDTALLDYMVANVDTGNWQATVNPNYGSDHWPVGFGSLQAAAGPRQFTVHADNSSRLLDVYRANNANGTHVITYHATGGANQRWTLRAMGRRGDSGQPLYKLVSTQSGKCLDVNRGQSSGDGDWLNIWDCHNTDGAPAVNETFHLHPQF